MTKKTDISLVRRKNFKNLLSKYRTKVEFSALSSISPAQVSQLASDNDKYKIGAAVARKIEAAAGKPVGWLDVEHDEATDQADSDIDLIVETVYHVNRLIERHESDALSMNQEVYKQLLRDAIKTARTIGSTNESQVQHTLFTSFIGSNRAH